MVQREYKKRIQLNPKYVTQGDASSRLQPPVINKQQVLKPTVIGYSQLNTLNSLPLGIRYGSLQCLLQVEME